MPRHMQITLEERGVSCTALLLDDEAPVTADLVWNALPQSGGLWHAKYASNEVYCLVPPLSESEPARENSTIAPSARDVMYFDFPAGHFPQAVRDDLGMGEASRIIDLAIFYGRNNLLLDPSAGWVPGNVFATIVDGFDEMAAACRELFRKGYASERLSYARLES
jgi:hypothetical protein